MNEKRALIVGTPTALLDYKTGASIRLNTVKRILVEAGYEIKTISNVEFVKMPTTFWDLIVVVSFAASQSLKKARVESRFLWLDATDSWHQVRISRFKSGEILQILALLRDRYRLSKVCDIDLITFISKFDASCELNYTARVGCQVCIFPNHFDNKILQIESNKRLVFVGDGNYGPNKKAVKFLKKVRRFLQTNDNIYLVGRNLTTRSKGFVALGIVSENELYKANDIHLAPTLSGSGIKNKVSEPLFYGLTVITTRNGSNGVLPCKNLIVCDKPKEFADAIQVALSSCVDRYQESIFELDESAKLLKILRL
jgi:hypothetical protein